ncbi:Nucleic-acid-binding protein, partial [Aphis craccivora]
PQFKNFQLYGHTRNWCHNKPRCVKCSENHSNGDCTKPRDTPAKCVLCSGTHTDNYRGCPITNKAKNNRSPVLPAANISIEPPPIKLKNYAKVTKNHNNIGTSPSISTILSNFISNLNAIISPLISLLTTVLNSLLTKVA